MILARLLSATPETDGEHWNLAFAEIQDVWGTDAFAQNPAPYQRNPQLSQQNRPPYPWRPNQENFGGSIAELAGYFGFQSLLNTANSPTTVDIYGAVPVNALPSGFAPQCPLEAAVSATGGTIPTGNYLIAIAGNVNGPVSTYFIKAVMPAGITTGSITVSGVIWQAAAPAIGVFVGTSSLTMHGILSGHWAGSVNDGNGNPTVFIISGIDEDGIGMPDPVFNSFLVQAKDIIHGGVWGAAPTSVGISFPYTTATFAGASWTTNQWAGYTLSSYGIGSGASGAGPFDWIVVSNTADTLFFSSGPARQNVGIAAVMRANAASITAITIGDPNFINFYAPAGLTVNAEIGNQIRIIAGTGAGQPPIPIASNTATVLTLKGPWAITPDATSKYIIEAQSWRYSISGSTILNDGSGPSISPLIASIPVSNFLFGSLLIEVITVDANGNWSPERYAPIQEIYVPPQPPASTYAPYSVPITSVAGIATATPDASQGENLLILTAAICSTDSNGNLFVNVAAPINYSTSAGVYTPWQLVTQEDPVGLTGGYSTVFDSTYRIGFAVASPASPPNTQCHVDMKTSSAGITTPTGSLIDQPI
jgi:hypothetical protein